MIGAFGVGLATASVPSLRQVGQSAAGRTMRHSSGVGNHPSLWQERREHRDSMRNRSELSRADIRIPPKFAHDPEFQRQRTFVFEVQTLGRQRHWEKALSVFAGVPAPHTALWEEIVQACAKAMQIERANRLFDEMPTKTVSAYNALILMFARRKRVRHAVQMFEIMLESSMRPDAATYGAVIIAHGMVRDAQAAARVFDEMEAEGVQGNAITFNSVIAACGKAGDSQRAKDFLSRMKVSGVPIRMNHITGAISACGRAKDEAQALEFFAEARAMGLQPDVVAYTALISSTMSRDRAAAFVAEMRHGKLRPDAYAYNQLLQIELESEEPLHFQELIEQMDREGLRPNNETEMRKRQYADLPHASHGQPQPAAGSAVHDQVSSLPRGWHEATDPASSRRYYWREDDPSGSVTWTRPS